MTNLTKHRQNIVQCSQWSFTCNAASVMFLVTVQCTFWFLVVANPQRAKILYKCRVFSRELSHYSLAIKTIVLFTWMSKQQNLGISLSNYRCYDSSSVTSHPKGLFYARAYFYQLLLRLWNLNIIEVAVLLRCSFKYPTFARNNFSFLHFEGASLGAYEHILSNFTLALQEGTITTCWTW